MSAVAFGYSNFTAEQAQPVLKLSYFNLTGLAEPIRMLLVFMNWNFTDHRIPYEQWLDVKKDYPFGKVPSLQYDGKVFHQSKAVGRFLAKKCGMYGSWGPEVDLEIDMMVDTIDDMRQVVTQWYYEKDQSKKKEKFEPMLLDTIPYYLGKLNKIAKQKGGYLVVPHGLTWADFYFTAIFDYIQELIRADLTAKLDDLLLVSKHVLAIPRLKNYWKNRTKSHLRY